jgi:predicted DNA-binding protein (UPF0278 family)
MPKYQVTATFQIETYGDKQDATMIAHRALNAVTGAMHPVILETEEIVRSIRCKYDDAQLAFHQRKGPLTAADYLDAAMEAFDAKEIDIPTLLTVWREVKGYIRRRSCLRSTASDIRRWLTQRSGTKWWSPATAI